jgi:hypothetical protein
VQVETQLNPALKVESAWSQRLKLDCDKLVSFYAFNFNLRRYNPVWRSSDPELENRLRKMVPEGKLEDTPAVRRESVTVRVTGAGEGVPLRISVLDVRGREGVAVTATALVGPARCCSPRHRMPC